MIHTTVWRKIFHITGYENYSYKIELLYYVDDNMHLYFAFAHGVGWWSVHMTSGRDVYGGKNTVAVLR